ncbi:MAG: GAF domain-containing protein [Chloroflexota bacterium]
MAREPSSLSTGLPQVEQFSRLKSGGLILLLLTSLIINILAPILALQWQRLPFFGVLVEQSLVVAALPGADQVLPDQLQNEVAQLASINGQPIQSNRAVPEIAASLSVGTMANLALDFPSHLTTEMVAIEVSPFKWSDFLTLFGIPYLTGLVYLAVGLFVYYTRSDQNSNRTFVSFCLLFSVFTGTLFNIVSYHQFTVLWSMVIPALVATFIHSSLVTPNRIQWLKRRPQILFFPYTLALITGLFGVFSHFSSNPLAHLVSRRISFAFAIVGLLVGFAIWTLRWYDDFSPKYKRQSGFILVSALVSFIPALIWLSISIWRGFQLSFDPFPYILILAPTIIFPVVVVRIFDRTGTIITNQTSPHLAIQVGLIVVLVFGYWGVMTLLNTLLNLSISPLDPATLVVYGIVALIFLEPIRTGLIYVFERFWPGESEDFQAVLEEFTDELIKLPLDIDAILDLYLQQVQTAIHTGTLVVFFLDDREISYNIRTRFGRQERNPVEISYAVTDSLPAWLGTTRNILPLEETDAADIRIDREQLARLSMLDAALAVPLVGTEQLLGWLVLGEKHAGSSYQHLDLTFLSNLSNQTAIALENAQRFTTADRKTQEQRVLQEINLEIASEQNTDRILNSVLERAQDMLKAMGGSIYLLEVKRNQLRNEVSLNLGEDYSEMRLDVGTGIAGHVIKHDEPYIIQDYNRFVGQPKTKQSAEFGSVLAIPFAAKGEIKGVLELVRSKQASPFDQNDLNLLSVLANQTAIALANAQLIQEAHYKASQLTTLNEVNNIISATLDRDAALELIAREAVKILGAEAGSIFLVDESREALNFEIALGPTGVELVGNKIPLDNHSIAGRIAVSQSPTIVNDVASDPNWDTSFDEKNHFVTQRILGVPMVAFSRVVGVIEVINKRDGSEFDENDQNTLMIFASQAAIALVNAQRFTVTDQALASRMQELMMLQIIDRELNATLNLDSVLNLLLENTMDALAASVGLIGLVDTEGAGLHLRAMIGVARKYEPYKTELWPIDKGIVGKVATNGEAQLVSNGDLDNFAGDGRSTSQLCVPIISEDKTIAVMSLELAGADPFSEQDQDFAIVLASHAVLAIRNAQLFEEVQSANLAKTEFMSVASHELKIPMTSIKGYAKLLGMMGGSLSDQQSEFLDVISANIDRMDRLVRDLLDVSRIEAGRIRLEKGEVQIDSVINEVVQSVSTEIQDKNLELLVDVPTSIPAIWADHGRLVQVMTNLISNAYKYTAAGGQVSVKVSKSQLDNSGQYLSVAVTDTGFGISEEDQQELFNKFFRASDPDVRDQPGTGLGLAITKSLIEIHGGEMWFESTLGEGSTFGFDLPLEPIPEEDGDAPETLAQDPVTFN